METKMKKIPFDLERAKKGELIYMEMDYTEYHLVAELNGKAWLKWDDKNFGNKSAIFSINGTWHHLIPDEPKPERWAVISKNIYIFKTKEEAVEELNDRINYMVVKLADDELRTIR